MVHELVKDNIENKPENKPRYEIKPRKTKISIYLNRLAEEEHELKNGNIVKVEIKPKVEEMEEGKK
jgi:hypothetical protein